jgi:hypothetical protein
MASQTETLQVNMELVGFVSLSSQGREESVSGNFKRPQRPRAMRSSLWLERLGGYVADVRGCRSLHCCSGNE